MVSRAVIMKKYIILSLLFLTAMANSQVSVKINRGEVYTYNGIVAVDVTTYGASPRKSASENVIAINAAINFAKTKYIPIYIPDGVYLINSEIELDYKNNGIIGKGTLKKTSGFTGSYIIDIKGSNMLIDGITVDGSSLIEGADHGSKNPIVTQSIGGKIINCKVINFAGHTYGIWVVGTAKNIDVSYNYVRGGDWDDALAPVGYTHSTEGIEVAIGAENVEVHHNRIYNLSNNGIYCWNTSFVNIYSNAIDSCHYGIFSTIGTTYDHAYVNDINIFDNTIGYNIVNIGVWINGDAEFLNGITVKNNKVNNKGISLYKVNYYSISDNYLKSIGIGVYGCKYGRINNNEIDSSITAIRLGIINGNRCFNNLIFYNKIKECTASGIHIYDCDTSFVYFNEISNINTTGGSAYNSNIRIDSCNFVRLTDNILFNNNNTVYQLIRFVNSQNVYCKDNDIYGGLQPISNRISLTTTTLVNNYGTVSPSAESTTTTVTFPRLYTTQNILVIQTYGNIINVKNAEIVNGTTFRFSHDAAVGTEKIFWMVLE